MHALLLLACATDEIPVYVAGDLELAEDLAYEHLFAPDGPVEAAGVSELRTTRLHLDDTLTAHARVRQQLDGVPVWGGEAIVHLDPQGALAGITDDLVPGVVIDTTPAFTADEAIDLAVEDWTVLTGDPSADLWILRHEGRDHLAWRVRLHRVSGTADDAIPVVFIDAHDGGYVWGYDDLQTATCSGTTNYYGAVSLECYTDGTDYYLEDQTELLGTYSWANTTSSLYYVTSTSTAFDGTDPLYVNAVEAHYVANQINSYYAAAHGRNGIDGAGGPGAITSHGSNFSTSTTSYSTNYVNASWDPTNLWITYGDGDGVNATSLTTLDIGGHEITHGVTQYEANLTYSGEPGHLNESMSDVFGAMVERSVLGESTDTWFIGEGAWTPGTAGDALRYMHDPELDGVSYDYYFSSIGSVDVHYGSGVANLAFYLLSQGGSHPRGASTTVVTAIGADAAADIWYLALTSYMTSSTNYSGARTATLSAAAALYGSGSTEHTQVGNAWTAVGVAACTTSTYSGSLSRSGRTDYKPSSSGTSVSGSVQTVAITGPSSADFDLYLQKKSGRTWSNVASSATRGSSTESISYTGTSGTYRVATYSYSGSGSYSLSWCR